LWNKKTQKVVPLCKNWGLQIKGTTSRWICVIISIFLGAFFLNYCLHWFQNLNWYNYIFFNALASTWIGPLIFGSWKVDFKYLKIYEFFPPNLNIDIGNILIYIYIYIYIYLTMEFVFIAKFIPNLQ
jgi:hypothetical protein